MNCQRRLSSLLLAAAFALGVLAAQVHPATIFLPLVARASTGEETPTPPPPGTVMVQNLRYHPSVERFYGELVNYTPCTVSVATVTIYLLDAEGLPITNKSGYPMAPILSPGQRTPLQVYSYDPLPAWDSYIAQVDWDPIDRLTVESAVFTQGDYASWQVTAKVRNQLPVRVQTLKVGAVLYGPSGHIIGYDNRGKLHEPLLPGATVTITRTFFLFNWDTTIEPVGCAVFPIPSAGPYLSLTDQEP